MFERFVADPSEERCCHRGTSLSIDANFYRERERERDDACHSSLTRATSLGKGTVRPGVSCSLTMCRGVVENCETKGFRSYGTADSTKLGFSGVEYSVSKGR